MKPIDIYKLQPISSSYDLYDYVIPALNHIFLSNNQYFFQFQKFSTFNNDIEKKIIEDKKIITHFYIKEGSDVSLSILFSIFFDNKPLLIAKQFGFEKTTTTYLTDEKLLYELYEYIDTISQQYIKPSTIISYQSDENIQHLEDVSGVSLNDFYSNSLINKYHVNDVVWAFFPYFKISYYKDSLILSRAIITEVNPLHPLKTYKARPLDVFCESNSLNIEENSNKFGDIYLSDQFILGKFPFTPPQAINDIQKKSIPDILNFSDNFTHEEAFSYKKKFLNYQNLKVNLTSKKSSALNKI